ncbi:hypothetical protein ACFPC0_10845 [Streptomyces andamanensis]|uniref:Uncharacterized protein n=1 Tax=Streptomyces andamanensis TaxID=1565035 RepID=A0ABV8TCR8_9ACTN
MTDAQRAALATLLAAVHRAARTRPSDFVLVNGPAGDAPMTAPDDLTTARRTLDRALAVLLNVGQYLTLSTQAARALNSPGTEADHPTPALLAQVNAIIRETHNTLDLTDPDVPDHPEHRCARCGSPKITYYNHAEQPFCTVCADGRGPEVNPFMPGAVTPHPECPRCHMPHSPDPAHPAAQVCARFFADSPGRPAARPPARPDQPVILPQTAPDEAGA